MATFTAPSTNTELLTIGEDFEVQWTGTESWIDLCLGFMSDVDTDPIWLIGMYNLHMRSFSHVFLNMKKRAPKLIVQKNR